MPPFRLSIAALLLLASFLRNTPAHAAWPSSPLQNVPLCTAPGDQITPAIVTDGAGGAIVAWSDARNGATDIYVQRVSFTGTPLWTSNGVPICTAAGNQSVPRIVSDGAGGAIVTWVDSRSGNDIYAQRVNAAGVAQWTPTDGVAISAAAGNQWAPDMVSDGSGGAIITWGDGGIGPTGSNDIFAQRVNASGALQWPVVAICTAASQQSLPAIASDGANGAIITWRDNRAVGNLDIYAQRVNAAGVVQWLANGVGLCTDTNPQDTPEIVSDGAGGAVVAWKDSRVPAGVYAQRVNAVAGAPQWLANGVQVTDDTNPLLGMVSDGASGAIINSGVKASRVHASGALLWGLGVSPFGGSLLSAGPMVADGAGGAIVAGATTDIYAQRLNAAGAQLWSTPGSPICTAAGTQSSPAIDTDGAAGAIIAWADPRNNGVSTDILAQRISASGYIGNPPEPFIVKVRDVPNDQGGKVSVSWNASGLDLARTISEYWIWRQAPSAFALQALEKGARLLAGARTGIEPTRQLFRVTAEAGKTFYWEYVGSQVAQGFDGYSYTAPTLSDSVGGSNPLTRFMVEAVNLSPGGSWNSAPDSGYSVDNLAPVVPAPFVAQYSVSGNATNLHWAPNTETDLAGYRLYRGNFATFVPGPGNLISAQPDTGYADPGFAGNYYKLSSIDIHGNESLFALITPQTTGDVPGSEGFALSLARAVPNPAKGAVTFRFSLPREGRATLTVYDQQGRTVRELVKGTLPAGEQTVNWNGRDDAGREVTPGVYFYRLQMAGRMLVQRVVMVR